MLLQSSIYLSLEIDLHVRQSVQTHYLLMVLQIVYLSIIYLVASGRIILRLFGCNTLELKVLPAAKLLSSG